ncbi:MAG: hypothetical protein WCK67_00605 [bacterium]
MANSEKLNKYYENAAKQILREKGQNFYKWLKLVSLQKDKQDVLDIIEDQ